VSVKDGWWNMASNRLLSGVPEKKINNLELGMDFKVYSTSLY